MNTRKTFIFKIILAISVILIVLGICAKWIVGPFVIERVVYQNMEIAEGTIGYDTWVSDFG